MIAVLIWIASAILPDAHKRRIFFEGPRKDEPGLLMIGCMVVLPLSLMVLALLIRLTLIVAERLLL